jgi:predicted NACHT family NTPase
MLSRLEGPARSVWAKHDRDTDGWLPLWRHMEDSAAVAGLLWDRWLPAGVRKLVTESLPRGEADARPLAVWLAGVHDIGKATPAFACQADQLAPDTYRCRAGKERGSVPAGAPGWGAPVERILVVGVTGAGKTTLARTSSAATGKPGRAG